MTVVRRLTRSADQVLATGHETLILLNLLLLLHYFLLDAIAQVFHLFLLRQLRRRRFLRLIAASFALANLHLSHRLTFLR